MLETARFEEEPGSRTKLIAQSIFQSVTDRDGMLQSGMEEGVHDSYERLDELLKKMQGEQPGGQKLKFSKPRGHGRGRLRRAA